MEKMRWLFPLSPGAMVYVFVATVVYRAVPVTTDLHLVTMSSSRCGARKPSFTIALGE